MCSGTYISHPYITEFFVFRNFSCLASSPDDYNTDVIRQAIFSPFIDEFIASASRKYSSLHV